MISSSLLSRKTRVVRVASITDSASRTVSL